MFIIIIVVKSLKAYVFFHTECGALRWDAVWHHIRKLYWLGRILY